MVHPLLDQRDILQVLFHPKPDTTGKPRSPNIHLIDVEVEPRLFLRGRLYPAASNSPAILFFHGNGEIAAEYDSIAKIFTVLGITMMVIDYRGYGKSDGTSTASNLLADALKVFAAFGKILTAHQLFPQRLYVMGRSLGTVPAIAVADRAQDKLAGLIIDSGFADTFALLKRLSWRGRGNEDERLGFGNTEKISRISIPTLIIHGEKDSLIPLQQGEKLYNSCAAPNKQLIRIKNAGHNTLIRMGMWQYFEAIQKFVLGKLVLDEASLLQLLLRPRLNNQITPLELYPVAVAVESQVKVRGILYPAATDAPVILYFPNINELATDCNSIAKLYRRIGVTLLVFDYRGNGASEGQATANNVLTDAVTIFNQVGDILQSKGLSQERLYVIGRSLGSAVAIEVARQAETQLAGLIIESGFAQQFPQLSYLNTSAGEVGVTGDVFGNLRKMGEITIPTLIIHGRKDTVIPVSEGQELYYYCAAQDKKLVLIENAGHNIRISLEHNQFFHAIQRFVGNSEQ